MYSNDDLERFYFQYQTEAVPSGESVQSFYKRNNVPYNIFSKWYKEPLYKMRDDRNAVARRNWMNRRNEAYVKWIGYKMIGLPWYYRIYAIVPIIKYLTPTLIYNWLHYRKR